MSHGSEERRSILYVSFHYPPSKAVASLQNSYMVTNLRQLGWKVDVVTIRVEDIVRELGSFDSSLVPAEGEEGNIHRARYVFSRNTVGRWISRFGKENSPGDVQNAAAPAPSAPGNDGPRRFGRLKDLIMEEFLGFPDHQFSWIAPGYALAKKVAVTRRSRIIYASGPPYSTLIIGRLLRSRLKLPLVLDIRDPWVGNPYIGGRSDLFQHIEKQAQRWVLRGADFIRANTPAIRDTLCAQEPECAGKIDVGTGGFPDFIVAESSVGAGKKPFTMTHAGGLYGKRDPMNFLLALRKLVGDGDIPKEDIRVRFLGAMMTANSRFRNLIEDPLLSDVVVLDSLPHDECLAALLDSDLLLVFQQGTRLQIPAKIYEYLSLGRRILTVADSGGATWDFIRKMGFGTCVNDDVETLAGKIKLAYDRRDPSRRQNYYPDADVYSYKNISQRLDEKMESLLRHERFA